MRRKAVVIGALFLASAGALAATSLVRPQGRIEFVSGRLHYDPRPACPKPQRPASPEQAVLDAYRDASTRYLNCLQSTTAADIKYASDAMLDGYNQAVANASEEIRDSY